MQATNGFAVSFRSRGRLIGCCMALALALSALVFAPAAANAGEPATHTYLALGDSISFGYTQERFNNHYPTESPSYFEEGFTNDFAKDLGHSTEVGKGVRLVNDACPGETSTGLIGENTPYGKESTESYAEIEELPFSKGGSNIEKVYGGYQGTGDYHPCKYTYRSHLPLHNGGYVSGGKEVSQLEEALGTIASGKPISAITVNIGSNDELAAITKCKDNVAFELITKGYAEQPSGSGKHWSEAEAEIAVLECIKGGGPATIAHVAGDLGIIVTALENAGYKGPIIVVGFYNPDSEVLATSDLIQEAVNYTVEHEVVDAFNAGYHNVTFANPFPVFNNGAGVPEEGFTKEGGTNGPKEQKSICKFTEMCNPAVQTGEAPVGKNGDIHPTLAGYKALGKLVNEAYLANEAH